MYRLTKRKNDISSIRFVWTENKDEFLGVVGQIKDFIRLGVLNMPENLGVANNFYIAIPDLDRIGTEKGIGACIDGAIKNANFGRKEVI